MGSLGRRKITKAKPVETHVSTEIKNEEKNDISTTKVKLLKNKSSKKTKVFQMRFSEDELKKINEFASKECINISDLMRIALIEKGVL